MSKELSNHNQKEIITSKNTQIEVLDKEHLFFIEYSFFSIKNSKTPLYAIFNHVNKKIYLKGRIGFLDDIYYLMKDNKYNIGNMTLLTYLKRGHMEVKMHDRSFISYFLDSEDKIKPIDDVTFKPVDKRIIYEDGGVFLNEYNPTCYLKKSFNNNNKDHKNFPYIRKLLINLCCNDEGAYSYLLKVLSFSINNPLSKRHGYIVFQGEGASGKGSFFELVMRPIFEDYLIVDTEEVLRTNFNDYSFKAMWVFIEEKDDSKNKQKGSIAGNLKYVSGNLKSVSERKGFDRKTVFDYRNWGMTSNKINLGLDLDKNDRRATIFGYSESLGGSIETAPKIRLLLEKHIPDELANFVSYLKNMKFENNDVFVGYKTDARKNIIELDMNNTEHFVEDLKCYTGGHFKQILKDYKIMDVESKKEIDFEDDNNQYNILIYNRDDEKYILLSSLYNLFKNYCEINNKHPSGSNKFSTDFSYGTRLKKIKKAINGKQKMTISLNDFLKKFNLQFDPKDNCYIIKEFASR